MPYGELLVNQKVGPYETPYKFTGKESDPETDLTYFGARYYDAALGIWLGVDPLAEEYATFTPFQYVLNNPINLVDPYGLSSEEPGDPPCVDCAASVVLPEITITAKRDGKNYDQTPVRYGYNGTWSQYQKEFNLTGWDYDNYNSYYNLAHRDDFNNYVAA